MEEDASPRFCGGGGGGASVVAGARSSGRQRVSSSARSLGGRDPRAAAANATSGCVCLASMREAKEASAVALAPSEMAVVRLLLLVVVVAAVQLNQRSSR